MEDFDFGVRGWWKAWNKKFFREKWPLWLAGIFMAISGVMAYGVARMVPGQDCCRTESL